MGSVKEGELSSPAAVPNGGLGKGKDHRGGEESGGKTMEGREGEKQKKRSSWLPDPEKRWPVQGW
ncbi:unnamed protein product [Spirodela intermedia]|uniref:Uncharacterized protein n=1 Tax=Spirodela intermedia TaxID=51605 RepID=A0A7I8I7Q6_SPIIN|nr:unnamed protein product [Spirodela intermedia]CAA6653579.1 unnamed protein product [Spirodela intermedia]